MPQLKLAKKYLKSRSLMDIKLLTQALVLAITAPTEAQATKAVTLAEAIARGMTKAQMERAKAKALQQVA